jgi:hypothetical protein
VELNPTLRSKVKNIFAAIWRTGLRHKWKTAFIIALCYGCLKAFNFYSSIKMMFGGGPTLNEDELKEIE